MSIRNETPRWITEFRTVLGHFQTRANALGLKIDTLDRLESRTDYPPDAEGEFNIEFRLVFELPTGQRLFCRELLTAPQILDAHKHGWFDQLLTKVYRSIVCNSFRDVTSLGQIPPHRN